MKLHGKSIVNGAPTEESGDVFHAFSPRDGSQLQPAFASASGQDVIAAMEKAEEAFAEYSALPPQRRAELLERIADEIEEHCPDLLDRAHQETGLSMPRLQGERARTCNQLRLFAKLVRQGDWVDARIDTAMPDRTPLPRPDLRRILVPLGPVVVFGASNFPLAFSVAGGDVASTLAAGCPVVVKAHEAHPGVSEIVAMAIVRAVKRCGVPDGVFALLHGDGHTIGVSLVRHPLCSAVAFTGSKKAGRALFDAAVSRSVPIPVFAEMASSNPIFILPGALKERGIQIAGELALAVTSHAGQLCTKPGLVFCPKSEGYEEFLAALAAKIEKTPAAVALHAGIAASYHSLVKEFLRIEGLDQAATGLSFEKQSTAGVSSTLLLTDGGTFLKNIDVLQEEIFGPITLVVTVESASELPEIARRLEGQLTATIHRTRDDRDMTVELSKILSRKVGRLIQNGYPTGVEVSSAMTHGGPYPATTDSRYTSVGTAAIQRFVRPLTFQNYPSDELPIELQDSNTMGIHRLVDLQLSQQGV